MPFIQQEAAGGQFGSLASGMGALASAMFPDPARIVQARLAGAQAAQADQATSDLRTAAGIRQSLPALLQSAAVGPNAQNSAAVGAALTQLGIDPAKGMGNILASNALGGPGVSPLAASLADRVSGYGGQQPNFTATQTGQQVAETGNTQRTGMNNASAERVNKYSQDQTTVRTGLEQSGATARQDIATRPQIMQQTRQDKEFNGQSDPFMVPTPGSPTGFSVYNNPRGQQPPRDAVPFNPQQPALSAPAIPLFPPQMQAPAVPIPTGLAGSTTPTTPPPVAGAAAPDASVPAGPAEGRLAQQAADAAVPGATPQAAPAAPARPTAPDVSTPNIFSQFAGGALPKPQGDSAGDAIVQNKLIEQYEKAFSAENPGSMIFGHRDYKVSDALRAKINTDASRYNTDRGNRITFGNMGPSFEQAWQDNVPKAVRDNAYFGDNSANSYLRLPSEKPTTDGTDKNKPGQSVADQAAAAVTPPGSGRQVVPGAGQSLPSGPAVRTQQNAPSIPGLPPPNMRGYGMVYRIPGRGDFIWRGDQGWEAVQGAQ